MEPAEHRAEGGMKLKRKQPGYVWISRPLNVGRTSGYLVLRGKTGSILSEPTDISPSAFIGFISPKVMALSNIHLKPGESVRIQLPLFQRYMPKGEKEAET